MWRLKWDYSVCEIVDILHVVTRSEWKISLSELVILFLIFDVLLISLPSIFIAVRRNEKLYCQHYWLPFTCVCFHFLDFVCFVLFVHLFYAPFRLTNCCRGIWLSCYSTQWHLQINQRLIWIDDGITYFHIIYLTFLHYPICNPTYNDLNT